MDSENKTHIRVVSKDSDDLFAFIDMLKRKGFKTGMNVYENIENYSDILITDTGYIEYTPENFNVVTPMFEIPEKWVQAKNYALTIKNRVFH